MDFTNNEHLVPFLRKLADDVESNTIVPEQLQSIGDFFMSYKFQEQAIKDFQTEENNPHKLTPDELTKFLFMGWYIYQLILKHENIPPRHNIEN